jgi:hypothetical protein
MAICWTGLHAEAEDKVMQIHLLRLAEHAHFHAWLQV